MAAAGYMLNTKQDRQTDRPDNIIVTATSNNNDEKLIKKDKTIIKK